eukprot:360077_1
MTDHKSAIIYVQLVTGNQIRILANETDTIATIKEKIWNQQGIPISYQKLKYNGKDLLNNKTILHYKIPSQTVLQMLYNFRGGFPCPCNCDVNDELDDDEQKNPLLDKYATDTGDCFNGSKCLCNCLLWLFCCPCQCLCNSEIDEITTKCIGCCCNCDPTILPRPIINNWSEYQRMLHNVGIEGSDMKPTKINKQQHSYLYTILLTVYDDTNNIPSTIRDKQSLNELLTRSKHVDDSDYDSEYDSVLNLDDDEIYVWLGEIGFRCYYPLFKAKGITMNTIRKNMITIENMIINVKHKEQLMQQIHLLVRNPTDGPDDYDEKTPMYPNNEQGVKLFLNDLNLTDKHAIIKLFMHHGINDLETLYELTDEALKEEIGIKTWGNRKKKK